MELVVERALLELRSGNGGERGRLMSVKRASFPVVVPFSVPQNLPARKRKVQNNYNCNSNSNSNPCCQNHALYFPPPLCQLPLANTFFKGGRTM